MAETVQELIAKLPPESDLIKAVIGNLRRRKPGKVARHRQPAPLWSRVGQLFNHGSGYSWAICVKYGFNPDEIWRPES
jgi:hypothetical protein